MGEPLKVRHMTRGPWSPPGETPQPWRASAGAATRLEGWFRFHGLGSGLRTGLTSKRHTLALAVDQDLPRPVSRWVESRDELLRAYDEIATVTPDVEDQCERFLTALGYEGLCGIELKHDPRDGVAKLIEVNPRYSLWDDIGVPVGVDLAHEAARSFFGGATEPTRPRHFRQKWVELVRDVSAALAYRNEGLLSPWAWLWSLRPLMVVNDLPILRAPGYAWHMVWRRLRKLVGRARPATATRWIPLKSE